MYNLVENGSATGLPTRHIKNKIKMVKLKVKKKQKTNQPNGH